jgi:diguanylate cyclase (GGDEF)-like protein
MLSINHRPLLPSRRAHPRRRCPAALLAAPMAALLALLAALPPAAQAQAASPSPVTTQPHWQLAGGRVAELATAVVAPVAPSAEPAAVEARLQSIERLAKRDPRRAQQEIAALGQPAMSVRGQLRLAAARAQAATYQFRMDEVRAATDEALPAARQLGDPQIVAQLLTSRASALHELNRGAEALAAAEEAMQLADRIDHSELRVDLRIFLAEHAARRGDFERAFGWLEEADQVARRTGGDGARASVAYTAAALARLIDDVPTALHAYTVAEAAFRDDGDPLGEADAARRRAVMLAHAGRHAEALDPLQRALARYHALADDFGVATATAGMAMAMAGSGQPDQGMALNLEAIALMRSGAITGDPMAEALVDRVMMLVEHRRAAGSLAAVEDARSALVRSDDLRLRMRFQEASAAAHAALGRYREAHAALAELLQLKTRYENQRLSRQLAAQRGRMESQRMAADLERARSETEAQRKALDRAERNARWQTLLILAAVAGIALALYALLRTARRSRRNSALAQTDYLTGIQNRRRISELGQRLMTRCSERAEPFAVLLLDLDHFKSINDDFGHAAGDRALQAVATELKRHLRRGDELGRYGGEEFAVVLPATEVERAAAIAERLRAAVAALPTEQIGLDRALTVSIGVASAGSARDFAALIAQADVALYAAKQDGRDRVMRHDALPPAREAEAAAAVATVAPMHAGLPLATVAALPRPFAQAE